MPGVGQVKAKSRRCVHGHHDADVGKLRTFSPTPQTESMMLFLQTALNFSMQIDFADVKNAFCQSDKMNRPDGPLYAEPCEGVGLATRLLIELVIPVYGLGDAPRSWRETVLTFVYSILFKTLMEPCWLTLRRGSVLVAMVLIEVDDVLIAATP